MKKRRTKLEVTDRSKVGRALLKALAIGLSPPIEDGLVAYRASLKDVGQALVSEAPRHGWRS